MMDLPQSFLTRPIAHRALHNRAVGRPENSRAAMKAAVDRGYGIEIDLQMSSDGQAMVFHDYDLKRLTGQDGQVCQMTAKELGAIPLLHGDEGIPTLPEILEVVQGKVPLLIEVKDLVGGLGPNVGTLEAAAAKALYGYQGDVALMSFNPHSVAALADLAPQIPRGLTTSGYLARDWPRVHEPMRIKLRQIGDFDRVGACFISHDANELDSPRVAELKAQGTPILCWTIRSAEAEAKARRVADNVTFEGYLA
ncbi:glycerophosphodiester phosphodiesterase family protein [Pseudoprimorskyibacter insulae]|uniref:Glycerophosphodiester phosphodiesterase, cytoplasmic n=1 Tax=Pseudoprimorskyibacter insulae TaxID=1695997 RepID=A0A2R8ANS0_9RHOB|nr:glycerophosphodiester phosphodiesterase family protein [Pseudoprimorskyibacter insulae]SPF77519.1 Glycerophosphodiester phosphodiesterase, cytoplasmic [Pseudoprimorskyibacter insulae]